MQRESASCQTGRGHRFSRRARVLCLVALVGLGFGFAGPGGNRVAEAAGEQVAVASRISGTVERLTQGNRVALKVGDPVQATDHILTSADSRARLQFPDGSTVVVGPGSDLEIAAYDMTSKTQPGALLRLAQGIVKAIVDTLPGNGRFQVAAPTAVAAVRGTSFIVQADKDKAGIFVIDGFVFVDTPQASGAAVTVQNNQGTDVPAGGKPSVPGPWSTERVRSVFALTGLE